MIASHCLHPSSTSGNLRIIWRWCGSCLRHVRSVDIQPMLHVGRSDTQHPDPYQRVVNLLTPLEGASSADRQPKRSSTGDLSRLCSVDCKSPICWKDRIQTEGVEEGAWHGMTRPRASISRTSIVSGGQQQMIR